MTDRDSSSHYKIVNPIDKELTCNYCKFQACNKKRMLFHLARDHTDLFPVTSSPPNPAPRPESGEPTPGVQDLKKRTRTQLTCSYVRKTLELDPNPPKRFSIPKDNTLAIQNEAFNCLKRKRPVKSTIEFGCLEIATHQSEFEEHGSQIITDQSGFREGTTKTEITQGIPNTPTTLFGNLKGLSQASHQDCITGGSSKASQQVPNEPNLTMRCETIVCGKQFSETKLNDSSQSSIQSGFIEGNPSFKMTEPLLKNSPLTESSLSIKSGFISNNSCEGNSNQGVELTLSNNLANCLCTLCHWVESTLPKIDKGSSSTRPAKYGSRSKSQPLIYNLSSSEEDASGEQPQVKASIQPNVKAEPFQDVTNPLATKTRTKRHRLLSPSASNLKKKRAISFREFKLSSSSSDFIDVKKLSKEYKVNVTPDLSASAEGAVNVETQIGTRSKKSKMTQTRKPSNKVKQIRKLKANKKETIKPSVFVQELAKLSTPKMLFWAHLDSSHRKKVGFHCKDSVFKELFCNQCPFTSFSKGQMVKHIKAIHGENFTLS